MNEIMTGPLWAAFVMLFWGIPIVALAKKKASDNETGEVTDDDLFGEVFSGWVGTALGGDWFTLKPGKKTRLRFGSVLFARASVLAGTYSVPSWATDDPEKDPMFAVLSWFDGGAPRADPTIITQSGLVRALATNIRRLVGVGVLTGVLGPNGYAWSVPSGDGEEIVAEVNRQREGGDRARYLLGAVSIDGPDGQTTLDESAGVV